MEQRMIHEGFKKLDKTKIDDLELYILEQLSGDKAKLTGTPKVSVGTDSKFHPRKGGWSVTYVTIVAFTFGNRGTHLIMRRDIRTGEGRLSLFDRLWTEVTLTVDLAMWIRLTTSVEAEVHLDVNPKANAKSNIVYDAAKGYGESFGFVVECKPDSPIAMCAADHVVRNKHNDKPKKNRRGR